MLDIIKPNPKFQEVCRPLTNGERNLLIESIKQEGCREPIIVWTPADVPNTKWIIDGHNRWTICRMLGTTYKVAEKEFTNEIEALNWIVNNQLSRRNLESVFSRCELALKSKPYLSKIAKKNQKKSAGRGQKKGLSNSTNLFDVKKELARMANVGNNTIMRVEHILSSIQDVDILDKLRSGETSIDAIYKTLPKTSKKAGPKPSESDPKDLYGPKPWLKKVEPKNILIHAEKTVQEMISEISSIGFTDSAIGKEINCPPSTFNTLKNGAAPSIDRFKKLCKLYDAHIRGMVFDLSAVERKIKEFLDSFEIDKIQIEDRKKIAGLIHTHTKKFFS